jgi:hypothetical protein
VKRHVAVDLPRVNVTISRNFAKNNGNLELTQVLFCVEKNGKIAFEKNGLFCCKVGLIVGNFQHNASHR